MIQPARVLPSNAPPLTETDSSHSRVLQEHSGNRQQNDYSYIHSNDQKYPTSLLTENSYSGHQSQPQIHHHPGHFYRQAPLPRHQYRYGSKNRYNDPTEQAKAERQARVLFQRFRGSDQYMKYRSRQQKDDKGSQDQKWPDRLELAFFQALVYWPPMGRRKWMHKEKQRGRNELIADYIEELTGEARTRKQVSSHIQVLKPFVEHDPFIMRYLSKEDLSSGHSRFHGGRAASHYHDTRRASSYHGMGMHQQHLRQPLPSMTHSESLNLSKVKGQLDVFEPVDFQMFVQRKHDKSEVERLHTYTQSITNPLHRETNLHDCQSPEEREQHACQNLELDFPLLAAMHHRRPLDCNVLFAQASLAFPESNFKDEHGVGIKGVELGISFLCKSRHLPANAQVLCNNTFYKDGQILKDSSSHSEVHLTIPEKDPTRPDKDEGWRFETQVKFGSTFWARNLGMLAMKLNNDANPDAREEIRNFLDGIQASQEIVARTADGNAERLLIIYWKFRLSTGPTGRAYWIKLNLPPAASHSDYSLERTASGAKQRVDSVYTDYSTALPAFGTESISVSQQPALQSPFEYDTTNNAWLDPQSAGSGSVPDPMDFNNDFDFSSAANNLAYDPGLFDLSTFDSSAFNFDTEFPTDPTLQDFSQGTVSSGDFSQSAEFSQGTTAPYSQSQGTVTSQPLFSQAGEFSQQTATTDYSQQTAMTDYSSWDNYSFNDSQSQSVTGASSFPGVLSQSSHEVFDGYGSAGSVGGHYETTVTPQPYEGQAHGGAGQDNVVPAKDEEFLGASAGAEGA